MFALGLCQSFKFILDSSGFYFRQLYLCACHDYDVVLKALNRNLENIQIKTNGSFLPSSIKLFKFLSLYR